MFRFLTHSVVLLVLIGTILSASIPSYIHVCHRSDPAVSKCIQESVEHLRPKLKDGIPELGVPPLEPLRIADIQVGGDTPQSVYKVTLKNIDVTGASNFQLKKLKLDIPNNTYKIQLSFPNLQLIGDYDANVQLLAFPINGHGRFDANASDIKGAGVLSGSITDIGGEKRMSFDSLTLNLAIGDYTLRLDNLFENDQQLTDAVNEMVNQNKPELLKFVNPIIRQKASEILLDIANTIVQNFNYDEVFPA